MKLRTGKIFGVLLSTALLIGVMSVSAFADTTDVDVYVHDISANTDTFLDNYTSTELNAFTSCDIHNYSSYQSCYDTYVYYTAKGPTLESVLTAALVGSGYSLTDVGNIKFTASDNYTKTLTKTYLLGTTRYYYNADHQQVGTVPTVLGTVSADYADASEGSLSATDNIRLYFGQTSDSEYTSKYFVKSLDSITVYVP